MLLLIVVTVFHSFQFFLLSGKVCFGKSQKFCGISLGDHDQSIRVTNKDVSGHNNLTTTDDRNIDFSRPFAIGTKRSR